jgi:hypothetical protein
MCRTCTLWVAQRADPAWKPKRVPGRPWRPSPERLHFIKKGSTQ